jgi:hypothetical protein
MLSSSAAGGSSSRPTSSMYHSAASSSYEGGNNGVTPTSAYDASITSSAASSSSVALTADLWLKIDQLHLNYLKSEESTAKIEIRKKLKGYIHEYLCLVPQERKFCNRLTSDVIVESARWTDRFSAVKAAGAFEAVETYASNVINQPWRKEFKEIKVNTKYQRLVRV